MGSTTLQPVPARPAYSGKPQSNTPSNATQHAPNARIAWKAITRSSTMGGTPDLANTFCLDVTTQYPNTAARIKMEAAIVSHS